jgi:hypothetical protein
MIAGTRGVVARRPLAGNMLDLPQAIAGYDAAAYGGRSYVSPSELTRSLKNAARALRVRGLLDWDLNLLAYGLNEAGRIATKDPQ